MQIPVFSLSLYNCEMMTIEEIRRRNLDVLIDEAGGVTKFAEKLEKDIAQVSQWRNASPNSKTGKARGMRDVICRQIEEVCKKERGWMDNAHPESPYSRLDVSPDERVLIENYRSSPAARTILTGALNTIRSLARSGVDSGSDAAM